MKELKMDGKTFKECWTIEELCIKDDDTVVAMFLDDLLWEVYINGTKMWSRIV